MASMGSLLFGSRDDDINDQTPFITISPPTLITMKFAAVTTLAFAASASAFAPAPVANVS